MSQITEDDLYTVYVYPDGEQYDVPPDWKSDDYEQRQTAVCPVCDEELELTWAEPIASCACYSQEWCY